MEDNKSEIKEVNIEEQEALDEENQNNESENKDELSEINNMSEDNLNKLNINAQNEKIIGKLFYKNNCLYT